MRFEASKGAKFHNKGKFKMTKEQKPTVGRIVQYVVENDFQAAANKAEVVPAIVTQCNEDGSLNLHVLINDAHPDGSAISLMRFNVVDWSTGAGHWQWPLIEKQEVKTETAPALPATPPAVNEPKLEAKQEDEKSKTESKDDKAAKSSKTTTPETDK